MQDNYHYIDEARILGGEFYRHHDIGIVRFFVACNGYQGCIRKIRCTCKVGFVRAACLKEKKGGY